MTKKYQHILFATDLNDKNLAPIENAQQIAKSFDAKFSLLHVIRTMATTYGYIGDYNLEKQLVEQANNAMKKLGAQFDIDQKDLHIVQGYPKEDIIRFSDENDVDLIILNGHSHNFIGALGSTANSVANRATCDILILAEGKK
ncbi:universal stress protein [Piscirickettsia litoralis]|uniref:Universal stress protein n=1 Tax=Piscirickettsia litoralis TaxID=1891921 RepID=A0ABX3A2J7_9GAMM|nr:universal stress protein [Piscirickettsia litoralis]ODN41858.1 universal stress family protein [Piscirickettsia litoralis]